MDLSAAWESRKMIKVTESRPHRQKRIQSFLCFTLKCRYHGFIHLLIHGDCDGERKKKKKEKSSFSIQNSSL